MVQVATEKELNDNMKTKSNQLYVPSTYPSPFCKKKKIFNKFYKNQYLK